MTSADDNGPDGTEARKPRREGAVSNKTSAGKSSAAKAGPARTTPRTATPRSATGKSGSGSGSGRSGTSSRTTPAGRTTPRAEAPSGRYTPPIPSYKKQSPPWFPWTMLAVFLIGLVVIVVNYAQVFWNPASNWALAGGLFCILAGAVMATQWR